MTGRFAFSVFVFDAEAAELTRNGRQLRIPEQTALILTILLEHAGQLVTREELQNRIWPNGEVFNPEIAMNKAIYQLRMVLRDNPRSPHFVETIVKRGYRFRAKVTLLPSEAPSFLRNGISTESQQTGSHPHELTLPAEFAPAVRDENDLEGKIPSLIDSEETRSSSRYSRIARAAEAVSRRQLWTLDFALALLLLISIGVIAFHKPQVTHGADAQYLSMGIPPFEVQGTGAEQLAESFHLDLADALSQLPEVQVRATHSFANLRLDDANIPQISRTLHLDLLLRGKFTLQGKTCILRLELVRASDATHLASLEYSGSEEELTTIRDKIQHDIFTRLKLAKNTSGAMTGSTEDPQAYDSYLMARDFAVLLTPKSLNKAIQLYQDAVARDPNFAKAYAGMADAYMADAQMAINNANASFAPANASLHKAEELATKALQLDPLLAEPHAVLGNVASLRDWNLPLGEKEVRRAIELDPRKANYRVQLASILLDEGRFDESLTQIDLAHSEDPLWANVYNNEGLIALCAHQDARAIAAAQKFMELAPNMPALAHSNLGWAFFSSGRYKDASTQWRLAASITKDVAWMALEDKSLVALQQGGASAYAQVRVHAIESGIKTSYDGDFVPSEWYAYAGNRDKAITSLEDMVHRHDPGIIDLAVNPMYDNLHHDPQFLALLNRVGLTLPASYPKPELQASLR